MAKATVNIKVTELEPFVRFIAKVAEAYTHFCGMSAEDMKALPDGAVRAYVAITSALSEVGAHPAAPVREFATQVHTEALRDLGERTLEQMLREQTMRSPRRTG